MNVCLDLFLTFAQVGACTFGGGYAMLPILQREVVEKRGWATEEEVADYYAIGQCTPGIIAVNTATFVGQKQQGTLGAACATFGLIFPALVIIGIIATFLERFAELPVVGHAFAGVRACVCALILSSVLKLRKSTIIDGATTAVFLVALALALVRSYLSIPNEMAAFLVYQVCSPVGLVILAGLAGVILRARKGWKT
ncbi:MAG: chromate transporter [Oscillospiraceae bacterium]|nr:chromate transporter [Oscillospiraceae bacterium]